MQVSTVVKFHLTLGAMQEFNAVPLFQSISKQVATLALISLWSRLTA